MHSLKTLANERDVPYQSLVKMILAEQVEDALNHTRAYPPHDDTMILFDANMLVHAHAVTSPCHAVAQRLRDQAAQGDLEACLSPQVLCEFFSVITDDRVVKPALTSAQANTEIKTSRSRRADHRHGTRERL